MKPSAPPLSRRDEYAAATREALLKAAREVFEEVGFRAAALEEIASRARLTRGAVYHHYKDKSAIFDAVVCALCAETSEQIARSAKAEKKVWDRLHVGMDAYLDECVRPAYRRLVIEEAPSVLGRRRYREIEEANSLRLIRATLDALLVRGQLASDDPDLLARMLEAMICEVALLLPDAADPSALRSKAHDMIERMLCAFKPTTRPASRRS